MAKLQATLLPHQRTAVDWCLEKEAGGCVLADDMGLGKTVSTCAVMVRKTVPTIIVAPLALLPQWKDEVAKHTEGLKVLIYHGTKRFSSIPSFADHDVILTNPETLVSDYKKRMAAVYSRFERLIVDEAHMLRNRKSMIHKAVEKMFADPAKIFLTGTPVCNKTEDLINMVTLLNLDPYSDPEFWKRVHITEQIAHLQTIRASYVLRRTKAEILASQLPRKHIKEVTLQLDTSEIYSKEYRRMRARVIKPVIAKILRLRQCVNQISLVHNQLQTDPLVLQEYNNCLPSEISAKLNYIRNTVREIPAGEKIVIFSQWTTMLAHIKTYLGADGIVCQEYTGKMNTQEKEAALDGFKTNPSMRVLLMSLRAGSCGLNLCVANHVIITEPYFNNAEENQAIDRVYRIGQTKDVYVHKLIVPSTVENWMIQLQKYKNTITTSILNNTPVDDVVTEKDTKTTMFHEFVQ